MSETTLAVTGMTCTACAHHVEKALLRLPGVRKVEVDYPRASRGLTATPNSPSMR